MYVYIDHDGIVLLIIYVDDLLLTRSHIAKIKWLAMRLQAEFKMSMLGSLAMYLGVTFHYERAGILMSHSRYIFKCLEDLGLLTCLPAAVPLNPNIKLSLNMDSPFLADPTYYRVVVGKLLHLNNIRPDIVYTVGIFTRFTQALRVAHLKAGIHVFRYLKGTKDLAILYPQREKVVPSGYTDSDFQGDLDDGYLFNIGSGPTSWRSKLKLR